MNYLEKDINKFKVCNAIITRGAIGSSSDRYAKEDILGLNLKINKTCYNNNDVVGVSVNGARKNRVSFDRKLVQEAIIAGALIVKDNIFNTNRSFNLGEKELEEFLINMGCVKIEENNIRSSWKLK